MSSNLKFYSQINDRVKFFLGIAEPVCGGEVLSDFSLVTISDFPGSIVTNADNINWESACDERSYVGVLMKDLGTQVTVVDANGAHLAVFRKIQFVNGPATEGVPAVYATGYYVKTWSADGSGVFVARTG